MEGADAQTVGESGREQRDVRNQWGNINESDDIPPIDTEDYKVDYVYVLKSGGRKRKRAERIKSPGISACQVYPAA